MANDAKAESFGDSGLPALNLVIFKLEDRSTVDANDMVMVLLFVEDRLVPCLTIPELSLRRDT
jgi:hypothetical protein